MRETWFRILFKTQLQNDFTLTTCCILLSLSTYDKYSAVVKYQSNTSFIVLKAKKAVNNHFHHGVPTTQKSKTRDGKAVWNLYLLVTDHRNGVSSQFLCFYRELVICWTGLSIRYSETECLKIRENVILSYNEETVRLDWNNLVQWTPWPLVFQ